MKAILKKCPKDIVIEYTIKKGILKGKKIIEGIHYSEYVHKIMFCGCTKKHKEIQRYINELGYKIALDGEDVYIGKYVIVSKNLNNISEKELQEIEANMVANKLGGN
jgi:hypothetical protein